jgi:hypothetical protein
MDWDDDFELDADDSFWLSNANPRWVKGLQRAVTLYFWVIILSCACYVGVFVIQTAHESLEDRTAEIERRSEAATVKLPAGPVGHGSIRVETFDKNGNRVAYNIDTKASDRETLRSTNDELDDVLSETKTLLVGLCILGPVILLAVVLAIWSFFLLTAREPGTTGDDGLNRWRMFLRIAPFAILPLILLRPFVGDFDFVIKLASSLLGMLLFVGQFIFLRRYVRRIPNERLERTAEWTMDWLTRFPLGALALFFLASFVAGPFLKNNSTVIVSVFLAIWGVLLIRYLIILLQFRTAFRNAACNA